MAHQEMLHNLLLYVRWSTSSGGPVTTGLRYSRQTFYAAEPATGISQGTINRTTVGARHRKDKRYYMNPTQLHIIDGYDQVT